jgi:hypothetical protein
MEAAWKTRRLFVSHVPPDCRFGLRHVLSRAIDETLFLIPAHGFPQVVWF